MIFVNPSQNSIVYQEELWHRASETINHIIVSERLNVCVKCKDLLDHYTVFSESIENAREQGELQQDEGAKTSVSPRSSPPGTFRKTSQAAKSEFKRMFSQAIKVANLGNTFFYG